MQAEDSKVREEWIQGWKRRTEEDNILKPASILDPVSDFL